MPAPTFVASGTEGRYSTVRLKFSRALDESSVPATSALRFDVVGFGQLATTSVNVVGDEVICGVAPVLTDSSGLSYLYNQPGSDPLKAADDGSLVESIGGTQIGNATPAGADTEPPELLDADVDGTAMRLIFGEVLNDTYTPAASRFGILVNDDAAVAPSARTVDGCIVRLTLAAAPDAADDVFFTYDATDDNALRDDQGVKVPGMALPVRVTNNTTAGGVLEAYLSDDEASDFLEELPSSQLASYRAAASADRRAARKQATKAIDAAMRYQGRRYDTDPAVQVLEFPRVPYPLTVGYDFVRGEPVEVAEVVWDWDEAADAAVVPEDVKLACLYEADSILSGNRDERMDARHDGVNAQSADGLSESYSGPSHALCRRAHELMRKYELRSGQLL